MWWLCDVNSCCYCLHSTSLFSATYNRPLIGLLWESSERNSLNSWGEEQHSDSVKVGWSDLQVVWQLHPVGAFSVDENSKVDDSLCYPKLNDLASFPGLFHFYLLVCVQYNTRKQLLNANWRTKNGGGLGTRLEWLELSKIGWLLFVLVHKCTKIIQN